MRSRNFITCLAAGSLFIATAATATPPQTDDENDLQRLSMEWMTAIERKDKTSLESFLADDYVLQMPGDTEHQYVHRSEWLENAISMDWSNFRYENIVARVHGDHATVSSRLYFKVSPYPLTFDSGVLDVWEKRGGKWQVTTRYVGESRLKERISFMLGALAAALAMFAAHLIKGIARRARRRAA